MDTRYAAVPAGPGPELLFRTVQEDIRHYIIEHGLQGGDPLPPETHLARDLGIGRHSVREAVKALESLGILESRPGRGLFVRPFSLDPILDNLAYSLLFDRSSIVHLLDVREQLEVGLLPRAVGGLTSAQRERLQALLQRMRDKVDRGVHFQEEDQVFHRLLAEASGNPLAVKLLGVFWTVLNRVRDQSIAIDDVPEKNWQNHARILGAVEAGDAAAAQQAMVTHFADLEARIDRAGLRAGLRVPSRHTPAASRDGGDAGDAGDAGGASPAADGNGIAGAVRGAEPPRAARPPADRNVNADARLSSRQLINRLPRIRAVRTRNGGEPIE